MAGRDDYQEVADRIVKFYEAFPDGRLTSEVYFETLPIPRVIDTPGRKDGDKVGPDNTVVPKRERQEHSVVVICKAKAYRSPDDTQPCVGIASEPFPGITAYTKDSEVMNAETSAWGRAIVATGVTGSKKIASANEVRNRSNDRGDEKATERPTRTRTPRKPTPVPASKDEAPVTQGGDTETLPLDQVTGPAPTQVVEHDPYAHDGTEEASGVVPLPDGVAAGETRLPPPGVDPETGDTGIIERQRERVGRLIADLDPEAQTKLRKAWKAAGMPKPGDLYSDEDFAEADRLIGEVWGGGWSG